MSHGIWVFHVVLVFDLMNTGSAFVLGWSPAWIFFLQQSGELFEDGFCSALVWRQQTKWKPGIVDAAENLVERAVHVRIGAGKFQQFSDKFAGFAPDFGQDRSIAAAASLEVERGWCWPRRSADRIRPSLRLRQTLPR